MFQKIKKLKRIQKRLLVFSSTAKTRMKDWIEKKKKSHNSG
jgi:hypothetical protein